MSLDTEPADPLTDIPVQENNNPRGNAAEAIFHVIGALKPDECDALLDVYRLYDESGLTLELTTCTRLNSIYLGGYPAWEKRYPNVFVPDGTDRIHGRLSMLIHCQNADHWNFNLIPFPARCIPPEVTLDWQEPGLTGVSWHADYTSNPSVKDDEYEPKLVGIVQLSETADFDGGEFEVYSGTQIVRPKLERGDMVLFPSFFLHRRQAITKGHRFTLMVQASGPRWR
jgi:hypothetical protein